MAHKRIVANSVVIEQGQRVTSFGPVLYIQIHHRDDRRLTWPQICAVFNDHYPGKWAFQMFPPARQIVDELNIYHLFVLDTPPDGVNINKFRNGSPDW